MPIKDVKDVEAEFVALLKQVRLEPVRLQSEGVDVAVVLSPEHFRILTRPSYKV